MQRILFIFIFLLFLSGSCFADITLYLYPRVNHATEIQLSDVASIEGDPESVARIRDLRIEGRFFADGYLDRKELMDMLAEKKAGKIHIVGSGVRITEGDSDIPRRQATVKKGDTVRFQVASSFIVIELRGTAMKDGAVGDVIPVKLKGAKTANGKVLNERTVELEL
ncbi:MAG: hypothetical protein A2W19_08585 [Spirochaetes bacterium RBG_16_49_21]|nr:MAG: hypothetical protein A2W19_08585 [Spirochaetes bacterium RBG_16_49_21]